MPLLMLQTSKAPAVDKKEDILKECSALLARDTGKPEKYVMVAWSESVILLDAKSGPAAFVDIRGIGGLTPDVNRKLSKDLCDLLQTRLGIKPESVYLNFTDVAATNWGWKGSTFG